MKPLRYSRRDFLQQSSLGLFASPFWLSALSEKPEPLRGKWGIILNTVRQEIAEAPYSTLMQLARMGYRYVEGGVYGDSASNYKLWLRDLGLKAVVSGTSMGALQDDLAKYLETAHALGNKYLTCYWPWLSSAQNLTREECLQTADRLNQIGKRVAAEGLKFTWHNHDKAFAPVASQTAFDWLMQYTDPKYVNVQLDLYWVVKGGHDPLDLFLRYPGRFKLLHIKDMDHTEAQGIACVGQGQIDFGPILEQARAAGVRYAMVEHEQSQNGIVCAKTSIDYLDAL
jgi:sugar phosphate isomerase/epimerase